MDCLLITHFLTNIDKTNNKIIFESTNGKIADVHTIRLPKGCYELTEINDRITFFMSWKKGKAKVEVKDDAVILRSLLSLLVMIALVGFLVLRGKNKVIKLMIRVTLFLILVKISSIFLVLILYLFIAISCLDQW